MSEGGSGTVGIILDNAGLELVADLCLADYLIHAGLATSVVLYGKTLPWFVSDTTEADLTTTLTSLAASDQESVATAAQRWQSRLRDSTFQVRFDDFWTLPHPYSEMAVVAPALYQELSQHRLIIFKGDLNYRKLVGDRDWAKDTAFVSGLCGFLPAPLLSLRTLKADLCLGLKTGEAEELTTKTGGQDWLLTGDYAVCSFAAPPS